MRLRGIEGGLASRGVQSGSVREVAAAVQRNRIPLQRSMMVFLAETKEAQVVCHVGLELCVGTIGYMCEAFLAAPSSFEYYLDRLSQRESRANAMQV